MRLICAILFLVSSVTSLSWGGELVAYKGAVFVDAPFADGDSFQATFNGETHVLRLYFVDCPESATSTDSDKRRLLEQSRYFGVDNRLQVALAGRAARTFVQQQLSKPFTVHTAGATAPGRSKKPRIYSMVTTSKGKDLAELLVAAGHARVMGVKRERPSGVSGEDYAAMLRDVELGAAIGKKGLWLHSNPERLVKLRAEQRRVDQELDALEFGLFANIDEANPLDLNTAQVEDLQQLAGVGPELAQRIIAARPFKKVDDLTKVNGIGPKTLAKAKPFLKVR